MVVFDVDQFPFYFGFFGVFLFDRLFNMRRIRCFRRLESNRYFDIEVWYRAELFYEGGGEILFQQVDVVDSQTGGASGRQTVQENGPGAPKGQFVFEGFQETRRRWTHGVFLFEVRYEGWGKIVSIYFNNFK